MGITCGRQRRAAIGFSRSSSRTSSRVSTTMSGIRERRTISSSCAVSVVDEGGSAAMRAEPLPSTHEGRVFLECRPLNANPRVLRRPTADWVDPFTSTEVARLVASFGSPLLVLDCERVRGQYRRLAAALPGVDLHYALNPLPHSSVINTLHAEGACFDLATNGEVELVRRLKVPPERCIHTHPIKRDSDIRTALAYGVDRFVIDNPDELRKFVKYRNRSSLLLRVAFSSPEARCDLSRKFGCEPEAVAGLFRLAAELRIKIDGLSFHVGSQAAGPAMFVEAIARCSGLMGLAAQTGHTPGILDIGGGLPVEYMHHCMPL